MRILAGEVGVTNTALALYERGRDGSFELLRERSFSSAAHASLADMLGAFLEAKAGEIHAAAFGVSGPVVDGACAAAGLPWALSEPELSSAIQAPVGLIDEFHAIALGVIALAPHELRVLQEGKRDWSGPVAVIGAGTGLGEALCVPTARGPHVVVGEGGHASFAPRDDLELRLLRFLLGRYEHVSVERVVSERGLLDLYAFAVAEGLAPEDPETLRRCQTESVDAVLMARAAVDPAAELALSLFSNAYGAEAGNWALKTLPSGGLFVAGPLAPRLIDRLADGGFMSHFRAKGRMQSLLESIPVAAVLRPNVGLLGARSHALALHDSEE